MAIPLEQFPPTLIRASAGTGKTFQLSNRYLGLATTGAAPDEILATTFTRKAAGEILERVLTRLAQAAANSDEARKLADPVGDLHFNSGKAQQVLEGLVHQLHRLRISTLDSFFAQLARSFDFELGLVPGWKIVEESTDARLRSEAVQAVLAGGETRATFTLLHLLTKGEATRSVGAQLQSLVSDLYSLYQQSGADAWDAIERPPRLTNEKLADALEELSQCKLPKGKRIAAARDKDLTAARADDWAAFIKNGLANHVLCGKTTYFKKPIDDEVVNVYRALLRHARGVLVGELAERNQATREFLDRFHAQYTRLKLARRALRFDDITLALGRSGLVERGSQLALRLDAHVHHVLFDEFQDTSLDQWRVLRPLVEEVMGEKKAEGRRQKAEMPEAGSRRGDDPERWSQLSLLDCAEKRASADGTFFCVGDAKQAIYGWRGGVAELFDALAKGWPDLAQPVLAKSRRSAQPIVDTVNRIFESLDTNPVLANAQAAAVDWRRAFERHTTAQESLAGYARMVTAPLGDTGAEQKEQTLRFAARQIARLVRESPGKSVGVLVRNNDAIATIIQALGREGISASEEGGNPLTDSPPVLIVLSLLALADHPGDTAARFHVAHSPLGPTVGLDDYENDRQAEHVSLSVRQRLMTRGYGQTIYGWARELAKECGPRDANRLLQLVELAYRYEPEATLRTRDFIQYVEKQHVEAPSPAAVRVMTIHKSKGLEFDIVVLPQLDVKLCGQAPPVLVGRPEPVAAPDLICRYPHEALRWLLPERVREAFDRYTNQELRESLCVLYVALTRAVHSVHMIVAPSSPKEKKLPSTFAGLLRAALTDGGRLDAETVVYEHGDATWHGGCDEGKIRPTALETWPQRPTFAIALAPPPKHRRRGLERESPSARAHAVRADLAGLMTLDDGRAVRRGSVFHAWFEQIEWLDAGEPDDAALLPIAGQLGASDADMREWLARFRSKLRNRRLGAVLKRGTYFCAETAPWANRAEICADLADGDPTIEVFRERPFAVRLRDTLLSGTFDRLVLVRAAPAAISQSSRGGVAVKTRARPARVVAPSTVVAAEVLDFKTDAMSPDDPQAIEKLVARYRPQLSAYREAVTSMFGLPAERVITRLLLIEADEIVEVE
jgi:ATP-dependent helicase/nuclease subunit A